MAVMNLKACYTEGEKCDLSSGGGKLNEYTTIPAFVERHSDNSYYIRFGYKRVNSSGNGVTRVNTPVMSVNILPVNSELPINTALHPDGADNLTALLEVSCATIGNINSVKYGLQDTDIITGGSRSYTDTLWLRGKDGAIYQYHWNEVLLQAYERAKNEIDTGIEYTADIDVYDKLWTDRYVWSGLLLSQTVKGIDITAIAKIKIVQKAVVDLVRQKLERGENYNDITWWQMQYYIINTTKKSVTVEYTDSAAAEARLRENAPAAVAKYEEE